MMVTQNLAPPQLVDAETLPATKSNQERWDNVCKMIKEKAKEAMGVRRKGTQPKDSMLVEMSNEKFKLQKDIEACTDEQLRKEKCKRKKQLKKEQKEFKQKKSSKPEVEP